MINKFDSEAMVKGYRMIKKKCDILDKFIKNHAVYFSATDVEFAADDVYDHIIDLMTRKNQLINLKVILDKAVKCLKEKDRKTILLKLNYNLTAEEICNILNIQPRSAFRRVELAFTRLAEVINNSAYIAKLEEIIQSQKWLQFLSQEVKEKHQCYRMATNSL